MAASRLAMLAAALGSTLACATIPEDALQLREDSLQKRQLQTRRIDGITEKDLLAASAAVLQDLGFNIDESETKLGLIVASKDRSAVETGQVVVAVLAALLGDRNAAFDKSQRIRICLVTRPLEAGGKSHHLRITVQRLVKDTRGAISKAESIEEPAIYQEFFDKLSKSIFLEAHHL